MFKKTYFILLMLSLLFISGCAFGTRHPVLTYDVFTTPEPAKNISIYVSEFKDERIDKNIIGHVRNGWGLKTAKVITETNISDWITEALKAELENIGYTITDNPNASISVSGEVIEIYVSSFMMYEGKASIEISLMKNGKEVFTRKYSGTDSSLNWASTAKSYGITLERSLQNVLSEAVHEIDLELSPKKVMGKTKLEPAPEYLTEEQITQEETQPAVKVSVIKKMNEDEYFKLITDKISENIKYPEEDITGEVTVSFTILANGQLKDVSIADEDSSKSKILRNAVIQGVKNSSPFPAFPENFNKEEETFNITITF